MAQLFKYFEAGMMLLFALFCGGVMGAILSSIVAILWAYPITILVVAGAAVSVAGLGWVVERFWT